MYWSKLFRAAFVLAAIAGCGSGRESEARLQQARRLLPLGQPQAALDALGQDEAPEARYLKAVALSRLQLPEAAAEQLEKAIEAAPRDPRYRAYQLRQQVLAGTGGEDNLIALYKANRSSSVVCLCAAFAFGKKQDQAAAHEAFRTSVALSDQAPEFLPEMLIFAVQAQRPQEARVILEKLHNLAPDDQLLRAQRLSVLISLRDFEEAIRIARAAHEAHPETLSTALVYGRTLAASPTAPQHEQVLATLAEKFPQDDEFVVLLATYVARSGRLPRALELIDARIQQRPGAPGAMLPHLAVKLALDMGDAEQSAALIEKYRAVLLPVQFFDYYRGRLLHLQHDYAGARAALARVIEAGKDQPGGPRALAQEAILALQKVVRDERISHGLQETADEVRVEGAPSTPNSQDKAPSNPKPDR